ncbi:hypothetical protein HDE76_000919 [Rhodanobacter sp. ANJX3]|uniref:Arm DNA-binding domain-containing protein n=1 Tax=unclassified Rhodanobacter TaxID=2621553 RepID=UPI0017A2DFD7|nr:MULTISPECIES: Arm DNA-binding domain-containing protein [unclassified Rhodanobacter]MBB5357737.1 hypothetical protein [Rhodanobacter sp. ANJX3]NYE27744.1 hypothetical protein [Rhodanobacter sp. K2T2]
MLTDTAIRKAKPVASPLKLTDGGGMYLLLKPDGGKYWRMNYRHGGKQKTLALGVYPLVTLADARQRREDARKLLANGIDPSAIRKEAKEAKRRGHRLRRHVREDRAGVDGVARGQGGRQQRPLRIRMAGGWSPTYSHTSASGPSQR